MIELSRQRLGGTGDRVTFINVTFFWDGSREFDAVVFCFWISYVPTSHLDTFLEKAARSTRSGGMVFFLDSLMFQKSMAPGHLLPRNDEELMIRGLDDGSEFTIVKNPWRSRALFSRAGNQGEGA